MNGQLHSAPRVEDMPMIVYRITNATNGKVYVGITTKTMEQRWAMHLNTASKRRKTRALYAAMAKYGVESFKIEQICTAASLGELKQLEQRYIAELGTLAPVGYNLTLGGDGVSGYRHSDEQRRKHSERHRGYRHTPAAIEKIRASSTGRVIPREAVERQLAKRRGAKRTPEQCARISAGRMGKGLLNKASQRCPDDLIARAFAMKEEGLGPYQAAARLGLAGSYVSRLFSGKRGITRKQEV